MFNIDMRTAFLSNSMIVSICFCVVLVLWYQYRRLYRGITHWMIYCALELIGSILVAFRGRIADWASIVVANVLILAGLLVLILGVLRFAGKRTRLWPYIFAAFLAVFTLLHSYFTFVQNDLQIRSYIIVIVLALVSFAGVAIIHHAVNPPVRRIYSGVIISLILTGAANVGRAVGYYFEPNTTGDFMAAAPLDSLLVLPLSAASALMAFSLLLLVSNQQKLDQNKTENALRENEARLREAQSLGRIGSWEYDVAAKKYYWSEETFALYERDPGLGTPSPEEEKLYYSPAQSQLLARFIEESIKSGKEYSTDVEVNLPGGNRACFHVRGVPVFNSHPVPVKISGTIQDITERKQAEEYIQTQAEVARNMAEGAVIAGFDDGIIKWASSKSEQLFGYGPGEMEGKPVSSLRSTDSSYQIIESIRRKGDWHGEVINIKKDGTPFWCNASITAFNHPKFGKVMLSVHTDITDRKKAEEQKQEYERQLIAQERLASLGQLVAGVAHELNNPLTSVLGFSELLMNQDSLPEQVKGDVGIINKEAQRTALIVRKLLTFARHLPEHKQICDLNQLIREVLDLRRHEMSLKNIAVVEKFAPGLPPVNVNGSQVQQVFFNLIINAEQSMTDSHGKGTLSVATERNGDFVQALISDDGPGIAKENMPRIFTPFFTTKGIGKGTGLGLSIGHGIITEHGGTIRAESEPGNGATFIVDLPAVNEEKI